jgi:chromosomal replication initiator protein
MEIVSALRCALSDRVGSERFKLWFGSGTRLELDDGSLTICVPSPFLVEFLRTNFRQAIESACRQTLGSVPNVLFRVEEKPAGEDREKGTGKREKGKEAREQGKVDARDSSPSPLSPATCNLSSRRRFADLESFVVGEGNRLAQAAAWKVAERPGELSPLLIYGPTGVGKTHLLEGIWTAVRRNGRGSTAVYLTAEQFATGFLQALRGSGLPSFRRKYRGVDLLIIDDLQFLCGKRYTQIELLYTIDTLLREGRQLVLAGDRRPQELSDLGAELSSRLAGGMVAAVDPPDFQTRRQIAAGMARRFGMNVPDDVLRLVASRLTRHARELSGALCRLRAAGEAWAKPITVELAQEALADIISASSPVVRLADIEKAVCRTFGLEPDTLHSANKSRRVNQPRMLAMWLARKYTRSALTEIGQYFGRRSHSTVVSAQKRVDGWLSAKSTVELADRAWGVEEALRQVEQCLRAS